MEFFLKSGLCCCETEDKYCYSLDLQRALLQALSLPLSMLKQAPANVTGSSEQRIRVVYLNASRED